MSKLLRVKIYRDGDFVRELDLDQDIIKVGRLPSSHLYLDGDGVARMHAVIEQEEDGQYRLIDLGSSAGSFVGAERKLPYHAVRIEKNAYLPSSGVMCFGCFKVEYEIVNVNASKVDGATHHLAMYRSLVDELQKVNPKAAGLARSMADDLSWKSLPDERRRHWIRSVVRGIRETRLHDAQIDRARIATMLNLGLEGIEEIFALSPEQAMKQAHEALNAMALAQTSIGTLSRMELVKNMTNALQNVPENEREAKTAEVVSFAEQHDKLMERVQTEMVAAASMLPMLLTRAGGHEPTDQDRAQWKAAFQQIKDVAAANEE